MTEVPYIKQFLQLQSEYVSYLMAITRDFDSAEEIFQNAAVVIMETVSKKETIHNFRAWSKEVVRRQALHYIRNQIAIEKKLKPVEPNLLDQITKVFLEDQASDSQRNREINALRQCIAEADDIQQSMLRMRYSSRSSFREIGQETGKTESAVQRALSRIRKQLHDCVRLKLQIVS